MLHRAAVEQPRADKMTMITNAQSDEIFDYQATAELFPGKNARARPRVVKYMRFDHAAGAIRFAVEQLRAIRRMYDRADYPLPRLAEVA